MSLNSSALAANAFSRRSSAGSSVFVASSSAARCTALGNTSLDDWPMFTWSLGCAPSPASVAMTSLAFMFDEVPEPVWKTSIGNCASCLPSRDLVAGRGDPLREVGVEQAEIGVRARRGALDPAEPAHHGDGHALPRDGEVVDGLAGLAAPQLLGRVLNAHSSSGSGLRP